MYKVAFPKVSYSCVENNYNRKPPLYIKSISSNFIRQNAPCITAHVSSTQNKIKATSGQPSLGSSSHCRKDNWRNNQQYDRKSSIPNTHHTLLPDIRIASGLRIRPCLVINTALGAPWRHYYVILHSFISRDGKSQHVNGVPSLRHRYAAPLLTKGVLPISPESDPITFHWRRLGGGGTCHVRRCRRFVFGERRDAPPQVTWTLNKTSTWWARDVCFGMTFALALGTCRKFTREAIRQTISQTQGTSHVSDNAIARVRWRLYDLWTHIGRLHVTVPNSTGEYTLSSGSSLTDDSHEIHQTPIRKRVTFVVSRLPHITLWHYLPVSVAAYSTLLITYLKYRETTRPYTQTTWPVHVSACRLLKAVFRILPSFYADILFWTPPAPGTQWQFQSCSILLSYRDNKTEQTLKW